MPGRGENRAKLGPCICGNVVRKEEGTEMQGEGRAMSGKGPRGRMRLYRHSPDQLGPAFWDLLEGMRSPSTISLAWRWPFLSLSTALHPTSPCQSHTGFLFTFCAFHFIMPIVHHCTYHLLNNHLFLWPSLS